MKRLLMAPTLLLILSSVSLWAQDVPKFEVFGGASVMNVNDDGYKLTPIGWTASVNGNVNKLFGIVGEVGGNYKNGSSFHSFVGGGQFTHRAETLSVFGQAKLGLIRFSDAIGSSNNLQLGFGGGIDWSATPKITIRLFQLDWMPTRTFTGGGHEWVGDMTRGSIGIVFKSGSK
jgi:opacity protein-like surface antigen